MSKKFLVGVGNANVYDVVTGELLYTSKTLLDDSIDIGTASTEVRAGKGHALQYIYYHTGKFEVSFTESQFNLGLLALNTGASIITGNKVWSEETVVLGSGGTGAILGTPILTPDVGGSTIYGWVTDKTGVTTKVTFSGSNFTLAGGTQNDEVCVRYYNNNSASRSVTVSSNIIPSVVRCVIDAQLGSSDTSTGIIGSVQIEIPRLQVSGSQAISLKSDGVANTPLKGMALAYNETSSGACASAGYYAKITEILSSGNWFDQVYALSIVDDSITLTSGSSTATLDVRAIPVTGTAFKPPYADLTFTSSATSIVTVGANTGLVTRVTNGSSIITVAITNKNTVNTQADITCS